MKQQLIPLFIGVFYDDTEPFIAFPAPTKEAMDKKAVRISKQLIEDGRDEESFSFEWYETAIKLNEYTERKQGDTLTPAEAEVAK